MKKVMERLTCAAMFAIALFAAPSAFATILAQDDFEGDSIPSGYSAAYGNTQVEVSGVAEISTYANGSADWPTNSASYPFSTFGEKFLSVDTDTNTLWRTFTTQSANVYVDAYMQFFTREDDFEIPDDAKIVIYLNADTNLCAISGGSIGGPAVTNELDVSIEAGSWHRFTLCALTGESGYSFNICLDGVKLSKSGGGNTFYSLRSGTSSSRFGVNGSGYIDNVAIRTTDPFLSSGGASIDGRYYATLEDALSEAGSETITLTADHSATIEWPGGTSPISIEKGSYTFGGFTSAPSGFLSISESTAGGVTTYTPCKWVAWGPGDFPVSASGSAEVTDTQGVLKIGKNNNQNTSTADYIMIASSSGGPALVGGVGNDSFNMDVLTVVVGYTLDSDNNGAIIGLKNSNGDGRFRLSVVNGAFKAGYYNNDSWRDLGISYSANGAVHYAVLSYSKSSGTTFYFDGLKCSVSCTDLKEGSPNITQVSFGGYSTSGILDGAKFHYVAVYNSKLTDDEALSAYKQARAAVLGLAVPTVDGENNCTFTVTDDSLYEIEEDATYNTITFNVAEGKKLTLEGDATLTGSNGITVTGGGVVETETAAALSGALKGDGTVAYGGVLPTGLTYSDNTWTGTVWLKGYTGIDNTFRFANYSNNGSKVKLSGVSGYLNIEENACEVELDDDSYGFALKLTDGYSLDVNGKDKCAVFKKLSGSGTLTTSERGTGYSWQTLAVKVYDASEFSGNLITASSDTSHRLIWVMFVNEGETFGSTYLYDTLYENYKGCIYVSSNATVNVSTGSSWSPVGGFYVDGTGTLNIAGGTVSGTLYGNATVTAESAIPSLTVASGARLTVNAALSGSITVADGGNADVAATSAAAFTVQSGGTLSTAAAISGAINLSGTMNVYAAGTLQFSSGSSVIQERGILNVIAGIAHMNVADRGIKGTINIQSGATFKSWGNDRLNYSATSDGGIINVRGTLDMDNSRWTMCKWNQINLYENATVTSQGSINSGASLDMNVNSGGDDVTIHAIGNATINAPIRSINHNYGVFRVDEGKTLTFSGRLFTNRTTKKGLGTLKLTYANGNVGTTTGATGNTYTVPTLAEGTIEFAGAGSWTLDIGEGRDLAGYDYSGTGSITVIAKQTAAECALGSDIVFANVAAAVLAPTITLRDGGTVVTSSDGTTATYTGSHVVSISGGATDLDWDFTDGTDDALEQAPAGVSKNSDSSLTFYVDSEDSTNTGVYLKHHPYVDGAASFIHNNSSAITVAAVGTMPSGSKTIFMNFGSAYDNKYGLLLANTTVANEVLVAYNYGATVTPITTMTVPNATTARHSYIITKEDGESSTTFTVYLDGIKWKTVTTNFKIEFSNANTGIQFGSDYGGTIRSSAGYSAVSDNTGILNVLRVYGRVITPAEIATYASTFPYVSPNGSASRTFATAAENWIDTTEASEVWNNSGEADSGTPTAGASLTVTATADTTITVNLSDETQYEALTINGSSVKFQPSSGMIKVSGMTVIGTAVTNVYGAVDMSGGPMTLTEDGDITFDCSAYDISAIYTTTDVPLTSDVDRDDTKVHLIAPSSSYRSASLEYISGHYVMRVTPDHEAGSEVYFGSGYLDGAMTGSGGTSTVYLETGHTHQTALFPGDTMVIDGNSSLYENQVWVSDAFIGNIKVTRTTPMTLHNGELTNPILVGKTITVEDGASLTISKHASRALTFGALTINGDGVVVLSGEMTLGGAVDGTAIITVSDSVSVTSTGSIANTITGSGTITYAALPASALSLGTWTGTVVLPSFEASGLILNNYGKAGSTIALTGITSGWVNPDYTSVAATLRLDGAVNITAMSTRTYTFAEISGTGNLSFATSGDQPNSVTINKVSGYSGVISSSLEKDVVINAINGTSYANGTRLLGVAGDGNVNVTPAVTNGITINGVPLTRPIVILDDGIYIRNGSVISYW